MGRGAGGSGRGGGGGRGLTDRARAAIAEKESQLRGLQRRRANLILQLGNPNNSARADRQLQKDLNFTLKRIREAQTELNGIRSGDPAFDWYR